MTTQTEILPETTVEEDGQGRCAVVHGSPPLSLAEISQLKTGDRVIVIWSGGNGPHEYEVRNDLDAWHLYRTAGATSVEKLGDGYHEVRKANTEMCNEPKNGGATS